MWYIDICLYITYIAKSWCAPVSYNFYQVSPLLRLIIYYFWEVFKILPNIYSTSPPAPCRLSFPHVFDHFNNNNNNNQKSKQACASIVAIVFPLHICCLHLNQYVLCVLHVHTCAHLQMCTSAMCMCTHVHMHTQTFWTDINCLPFGQGRPFFWHSFR